MTERKAQLIIVCEDTQQEVFARHFFTLRGFHPRKIRVEKNPKGKGAGEQYVRERYPKEVKAYRSKSNHLLVCLAIVIDADTDTVEQRLLKLDLALKNEEMLKRQPDEKIAIFVPKRNIETWIYYLKQKEMVDETVNYPRLDYENECKPYVKSLAREICLIGLPPNAPPSLHIACDELQRIL